MISSSDLAKEFNRECSAMYGSDWPEARGDLIIKRLDPPVDPDKVLRALRRYMKYYRFMPNLADINQNLEELDKEEAREKRENEFKARQQESDATYQAISSGIGLTGRAQYWHGRMKQEVALSNQYRTYLQETYGLDYSKPAHNRFLIDLINRARTVDGFLLPLDQAQQVAEGMIAEYRAEKSKNAPMGSNRWHGPLSTAPTTSNAL